MRVLVFGANGPSGRLVVERAIAAGHEVSAFVRGASQRVEGARMITGDATDAAAVADAMGGQEAVITTLGVRNAVGSRHLMERSLGAIVRAMEKAGTSRLVVMSALGVGSTFAQAPFLPRLLYRLLLRDIFADKARGEAIVEASPLDWTVVHPPLLTDGPFTGNYRAGETLPLSGFPRIARADVAHFMVEALASARWHGKHVIVSA